MKNPSKKEINRLRKEFIEKSQLKLIVSADLQASTSLKAEGQIDNRQPWVLAFEYFYAEFPRILQSAYDNLMPPYCNGMPYRASERLRVFKFIGDEILFQVTIKRHEQVVYHIHAALEAVTEFNRTALYEHKNLRCKPTAWLAALPLENSQVPYPCSQGQQDCLEDYIGPSMDCGFRLTRYASPLKFIVSFDLAEMIIDALEKVPKRPQALNFFYDGSEPIKGVINESPYPIIWIEIDDPTEKLEQRLKGIHRNPCVHTDLKELFKDFREKHNIIRCFIKNDSDPQYNELLDDTVLQNQKVEELRARSREKATDSKEEIE